MLFNPVAIKFGQPIEWVMKYCDFYISISHLFKMALDLRLTHKYKSSIVYLTIGVSIAPTHPG